MSSISLLLIWAATGVAVGWFASMVIRTRGREGAFFDALIGALGAISGGFSTQHFLTQRLGDQTTALSFVVAVMGAGVMIALWRLLLLPPAVR